MFEIEGYYFSFKYPCEIAEWRVKCKRGVYYVDKSVLVENGPLVTFTQNYIRDSSGILSYYPGVLWMMSFPAFTLFFVQK